jgi:hypothetical protein
MWISTETGLPLWWLQHVWTVVALVGYATCGFGMARWRDQRPWCVDLAVRTVRRIRGAVDWNNDEVANALDMRPSQVSRDLAWGGMYLAQLFALADTSEEVCAEARTRIDRAFAQIADRHDERRRRLEAVRLEPVKCDAVSKSGRSSAA